MEQLYNNRIVESYNKSEGMLNTDYTDSTGVFHRADGVDCPYCNNRGDFMVLTDDGEISLLFCTKCHTQRMNVNRLRRSGIERLAVKYTFDSYSANNEWQRKLLGIVKKYKDIGFNDGKWLYVGGQSGSGKSHLCTAATVSLMKYCDVIYVIWPTETRKIKAVAMDAEKYDDAVKRLQNVKLLYIDDFFKPVFNSTGFDISTSKADVALAYNILNYRYNNRLPTIISSELYSSEIEQIDEAIFGRIAESCGEFRVDVSRDKAKNYRAQNTMI